MTLRPGQPVQVDAAGAAYAEAILYLLGLSGPSILVGVVLKSVFVDVFFILLVYLIVFL